MNTHAKNTLTSHTIKQHAREIGLDMVGIANIERFEGAPAHRHPCSMLPGTRSVIVCANRIGRGTLRGIEEGTNWIPYTYYSYHGLLNSLFLPRQVYALASFVDDHGYDAVPYWPVQKNSSHPPKKLRPGESVPHADIHARITATAAGLGEIGWSTIFLTKRFGPRQRLHFIFTDAVLEPDLLVPPGTICDRCMACVKGCQSAAIPGPKEGKTHSVTIENYTYEWGALDAGKCCLGYHGLDKQCSPFLAKDCPGLVLDVTKQRVSQEEAYKLVHTVSRGRWRKSEEFPSGYVVEGHMAIHQCVTVAGQNGSAQGICAGRGCLRSCMDHLERKDAIEQKFHSGPFIRRPRWLLPLREDQT